jgi:hypothetical protein
MAVLCAGGVVGVTVAFAPSVLGARKAPAPKLPAGVGSVVPAKATVATSIQTASGARAAIWVAPTTNGWTCANLKIDNALAPASYGANGGGACSPNGARELVPLTVALVWLQTPGGFAPILSGQVSATSGITRIELSSATGSTPLSLARRQYIGELPTSAADASIPPGGPFLVIGYGATGDEVARTNLNALVAG